MTPGKEKKKKKLLHADIPKRIPDWKIEKGKSHKNTSDREGLQGS